MGCRQTYSRCGTGTGWHALVARRRQSRRPDPCNTEVMFLNCQGMQATVGIACLLLTRIGSHAQQQPIPYSHKTHLAMGLKCNSCHRNADPGELMGLPAEGVCMGCHQTIKADSPHIQKLAAAAREKKPIPWVRV